MSNPRRQLPGFSMRDFGGDPWEEREQLRHRATFPVALSEPLCSEPIFPRWWLRLIAVYIAAHSLIGLAVLIAAAVAIAHFLPLIQKLPLLIQRMSEMAG